LPPAAAAAAVGPAALSLAMVIAGREQVLGGSSVGAAAEGDPQRDWGALEW
jgi:hypothetical protein